MKNKILILGKGFIGNRLQEELGCEISGTRIFSFGDAEKEIKRFNPEIVINCIGHVGRNVDECELDIDKTLMANTFVPVMLAEAASRNNIKLVHTSSGCIFHYDYNKDLPIPEDKIPDFFELFYSRSKIYSELALDVLSKKYPILIIRIRVPLDNKPNPRNLLDKLIGYKRVIDLPNSVTYIPDFIRALEHLIEIQARGIYNVVNKGGLRFPELMEVYKKYVPDFKYEVIDFKKLNLARTNLVMATKKLEQSGFKVRDIHNVLDECVREYLGTVPKKD
jgi:3,5-epimerase/4-reductase